MNFDQGLGATVSRNFTECNKQSNSDANLSKSNRDKANGTMNNLSSQNIHFSKSKFDISNVKEFKLQDLAMLSISPIARSIYHWWLQRAEQHYLICADVEQQRAREAQMNVAYYQKRAALARSARL